MIDLALAVVWILALGAVVRAAIQRPRRHVWGEFNSADVASAARKMGKR